MKHTEVLDLCHITGIKWHSDGAGIEWYSGVAKDFLVPNLHSNHFDKYALNYVFINSNPNSPKFPRIEINWIIKTSVTVIHSWKQIL